MKIREILEELNVFSQCRKYGVSLWQCPQFLFVIMGLITIIASVTTYWLGTQYIADPHLVALIVLALSLVLLIIGFAISSSFERLAEANRMKSEFVSIVSHQLRTPLSNLRWIIELLMSGRMGEIKLRQIEYFNILKENVGRMGELIKDLLIVSKIDTESLIFNKKEFSLKDLIEKIVSELEPFSKASNVKIAFQYRENLPQALADPFQVRQVLENLFDNAIRYIGEKGTVKAKLDMKGSNLYIEIQDDGVGIPEEDKKHIFKKFFRARNIMKHQTQGSGLGLYIAKFIVENSGGKIGFRSQEGEGSTFWFMLPTK